MKKEFLKKAMKTYCIGFSLLMMAFLALSSLSVAMESTSMETNISDAGNPGTQDRALLWSVGLTVNEDYDFTADSVTVQEDTLSFDGPPQSYGDQKAPPAPPAPSSYFVANDGFGFLNVDSRFGPDADTYKEFNVSYAWATQNPPRTTTAHMTWNPVDWDSCEYLYVNLTDVYTSAVLADMKSVSSYDWTVTAGSADYFKIICEGEKPDDVGVTSVDLPTGIIPINVAADVEVTVQNYGGPVDNIDVNVQISGTSYDETETVSHLEPFESTTVTFAQWTPTSTGTYTIDAMTMLPGDGNDANNASSGSVEVQAADLAVTDIISPDLLEYIGSPVDVTIEVTNNNGNVGADGLLTVTITNDTSSAVVYTDTDTRTYAPGDVETVDLSDWTPLIAGDYTVTAEIDYANDPVSGNDILTKAVEVPAATHDCGVLSIDSPTGTIPPIAQDVEGTVYNNGTGAADEIDVPVNCKIYKIIPGDISFDFEADDGGWTPSGIMDWEWTNTYDVSNYAGDNDPPTTAHSGTGLWGTIIYNDYTNSGDWARLQQTFDFSGFTGTTLSFYSWMDTFGDWDYCTITADGTEVFNDYNYPGTTWEFETVDLSAWDGDSSVEISFNLYASTVVNYSGWYIDDVMIAGSLIGDSYILEYDETVYVDLDTGDTETVTFPDWTPSEPNFDYSVNMTTELPFDVDPNNDLKVEIVSVIGGDVGVAEVLSPFGSSSALRQINCYAHDYSGDELVYFDTATPGTFNTIASYSGDLFLGADFVGDEWYACDANNGLYTIDTADGTQTLIGSSSETLTGLAYDPTTDTLYGSNGDALYIVDQSDGSLTIVGSHVATDGCVGIGCDNSGNMYGYEVNVASYSDFYSIDTSTGEATVVGSLGMYCNYAQDMMYDKDNDICYLAAYVVTKDEGGPATAIDAASELKASKSGGELYSVDVTTGTPTFIGSFSGSSEIGGTAIPSSGPHPGPDVNCPGNFPVRALVQNYETGSAAYSIDVYAEIPAASYSEMTTIASLGPGENTTVTFPSVYLDSGDYTVTMYTVMSGDTNPSNDEASRNGHIAEPPVADANGPYTADGDNAWTVLLDGSGSYHPDGINLTYHWDFGDGETMDTSEPTVTHTFDPPEEEDTDYTVTLIVEDDSCHLTDMDTTTVTVLGYQDPPIIDLTYPVGGESVSGSITVEWYATDNSGVEDIYLYYANCDDDGCTWYKIAGPLENTGSYSWNTGQLSDGQYILQAVAVDDEGNPSADSSGCFTVGNGYSGTLVSAVNADSDYVKDGDTITISAGITGGRALFANEITADLSAFGMGTTVTADNYDGYTATWTISNIKCSPSNGEIIITVSAGSATGSGSVTADNTEPSVTVSKPVDGLYILNRKSFMPMGRTVIIGGLTIEVESDDNSGIDHTEFYLDGSLVKSTKDSQWYMNTKFIGRHHLEIRVFDEAGNTHTESVEFSGFNLFGAE
jgi:hypothetical protein